MDDIIDVSKDIDKYIALIAETRNHLKKAAENVGQTESDYYKKKGIVDLQLLAGKIKEFEGEHIDKITAGDRVILVKSICFKELADREVCRAKYKALITYLDALKAELNARQSQFRYLAYSSGMRNDT